MQPQRTDLSILAQLKNSNSKKYSNLETQACIQTVSNGIDNKNKTKHLTNNCVIVAIGSLAHTAGLQAGDIIVRLNGEPISQLTHAQAHNKLVSAGDDVVLSVMRSHEIAQRQQ
ncbi:hypothetical protein DMN91_004046 [Ooceraea biroi]|uniref:PDZ domain-containing protein n=1 Tax=Ooceraea biroi TaxID=2015173 RepID=A0A3L8DVQ3_OOCBI|nr:uncharacterized protein LOC105282643 isoform X1 [Ooceraea biroi]RLU23838.1 hypothetical protein DMN91_004046 [Ooceraea biroi]